MRDCELGRLYLMTSSGCFTLHKVSRKVLFLLNLFMLRREFFPALFYYPLGYDSLVFSSHTCRISDVSRRKFFWSGTNYKSNLAVLRNFADASSFSSSFGLFIALMTLLFMFFFSSSANFINKNECDGEVSFSRKLHWKLEWKTMVKFSYDFRGNKYLSESFKLPALRSTLEISTCWGKLFWLWKLFCWLNHSWKC